MRLPQMPAGAAAPCPERKGLRQADESGNEKSRPDMGRDFLRIVLTKATPGYAGGEKELIAWGGVDKKKSPS